MRKSVTMTGIVLAVAVLVSFVLYLNRVLPTTSETERRSGFDRSHFLVLLFPTQENNVCRRAVLASLDELERDSVEVYGDDGVMAVPRDRFTATPSAEYLAQVERLNQTLPLWGEETGWSRVEWGCESSVQWKLGKLGTDPSFGSEQALWIVENVRANQAREWAGQWMPIN